VTLRADSLFTLSHQIGSRISADFHNILFGNHSSSAPILTDSSSSQAKEYDGFHKEEEEEEEQEANASWIMVAEVRL